MEHLRQALQEAQARLEEARRALEALTPYPIRWRRVRCGKPGCRACPHGPYPYLRLPDPQKRGPGKDPRREVYLGKGFQPPEGAVPPKVWREAYRRWRKLQEAVEALKTLLEEA